MPPKDTNSRPPASKALGRAIRNLRKRKGVTQEEAARRANIAVQTWQRYEWGHRTLSFEKLEELAPAISATVSEIFQEAGEISGSPVLLPVETSPAASRTPARNYEIELLPIRDEVRAGAWLSIDILDQSPGRVSSTARDPRFPHADQWIAPVVGDSMNLRGILDGDMAHLVDAIAIGYQPVTGDVVEVERIRHQGRERELTLKEVVVTAKGVELWPRSTNRLFSEAIILTDGVDSDQELEVRIRGLMLQLIRRF